MTNVMNLQGFETLSIDTMTSIDGGWTKRGLAGAAIAGAVTCGLATRTSIGTVGGALLGGIGCMIVDAVGQ